MSGVPTLQSLALYAREHFGEDGAPFAASIPSSLDVIVRVYAREPDPQRARACACAVLEQWLRGHDRAADRGSVEEYVRWGLRYLQAVYPDGQGVGEKAEQRLLTHLFWGNLVEARLGAAGPDTRVSVERVSRQKQRTAVLV